MDDIINDSMFTTATTAVVTTTVTDTVSAATTEQKTIQLNYNNDKLIASSNAVYVQSIDDKSTFEIVNSNQFIKQSESSDTNSIQFYQLTDKMNQSHIEPIDISSSHTTEELDEKRENERVYEYLLKLSEVRK